MPWWMSTGITLEGRKIVIPLKSGSVMSHSLSSTPTWNRSLVVDPYRLEISPDTNHNGRGLLRRAYYNYL